MYKIIKGDADEVEIQLNELSSTHTVKVMSFQAGETGCACLITLTKKITKATTKLGVYDENFERFWAHYPKKVGKGAAEKSWSGIKPDKDLINIIINAVLDHKESHDWQKDGGQYIPNPSTWLNQKRWQDEGVTTIEKEWF